LHNYAGPGTHTYNRIVNGDKPVSVIDAASLIHDIEYTDGRIGQYKADINMLHNMNVYGSYLTTPVAIAFMAKSIIGYPLDSNPEKADIMRNNAKHLLKEYPHMKFLPIPNVVL